VLILRPHHSDVSVLNPRTIKLRLRLRHIRFWSGPALKAILCELQRIGVIVHGVIQKLLLHVGTAQFEVVDGQLGMQAKIGSLKIGGAGLSFPLRRVYGAADSAHKSTS